MNTIDIIRAEIESLKSIEYPCDNSQQATGFFNALDRMTDFLSTLEESEKPMEQQEVNLEKFTDKMEDWKARYNYPDNISIKATMAFTARMFYMYPKVAREWYESLPKVTQD